VPHCEISCFEKNWLKFNCIEYYSSRPEFVTSVSGSKEYCSYFLHIWCNAFSALTLCPMWSGAISKWVSVYCLSKYVTDLWIAETRIGRFQAGRRMRRLNLALVFLFIWGCRTFVFLLNVCFCCVRFSFSIPSQEIGLGNVSEITYFVWSETWSLTRASIKLWHYWFDVRRSIQPN